MKFLFQNNLINRLMVVISINLLGILLIHQFYFSDAIKNEKIFTFPIKIKEWKGRAIPMQNWVLQSLQTPYAIMRDYYSKEGDSINLTIVWYDDKKIDFHSPEMCLGGIGNQVIQKKSHSIAGNYQKQMDVAELIVDIHNMKVLVYYYYLNETYLTNNLIKLRFQVLLERLQVKRTSAAFVRLMIPITESIDHTRKVLDHFSEQSLPLIMEYTNIP